MKRSQGFTLIELMVSITILAIIVSSGINIFFRSIRDTSRSDLRRIVDERSRIILGSMTKFLRESRIESLDGTLRPSCVSSQSITGNSLVASDPYGVVSTFSLAAGKLSSASAVRTLQLNPETAITIEPIGADPLFTWHCAGGVVDRIVFSFRLTAVGEGGSGTISNDYSLDLTLRNTGQ